jgi:hypothetical protein
MAATMASIILSVSEVEYQLAIGTFVCEQTLKAARDLFDRSEPALRTCSAESASTVKGCGFEPPRGSPFVHRARIGRLPLLGYARQHIDNT